MYSGDTAVPTMESSLRWLLLFFFFLLLGSKPSAAEKDSQTTTIAARLERIERDEEPHAGRNTALDHETDGEGLALELPEVAQQFSVDRALHLTSSCGAFLCALHTTPAMAPSLKRITRSAISAMSALCVITTVVVPSSRL